MDYAEDIERYLVEHPKAKEVIRGLSRLAEKYFAPFQVSLRLKEEDTVLYGIHPNEPWWIPQRGDEFLKKIGAMERAYYDFLRRTLQGGMGSSVIVASDLSRI